MSIGHWTTTSNKNEKNANFFFINYHWNWFAWSNKESDIIYDSIEIGFKIIVYSSDSGQRKRAKLFHLDELYNVLLLTHNNSQMFVGHAHSCTLLHFDIYIFSLLLCSSLHFFILPFSILCSTFSFTCLFPSQRLEMFALQYLFTQREKRGQKSGKAWARGGIIGSSSYYIVVAIVDDVDDPMSNDNICNRTNQA